MHLLILLMLSAVSGGRYAQKNQRMNIVYTLDKRHINQLYKLYQQGWWTKGRSLQETEKCVIGSQICIGAIDQNNDLLGFARVLTDYTFKALIFDVIVRRDQRGKGIGDELLSVIKTHSELQAVKHFELYCLPDMSNFYTKHGFSSDVGEIKLMRYINA